MIVSAVDRTVLHWAFVNGYVAAYCRNPGMPDPCLMITLDHATAFLAEGRLIRIVTLDDPACLDELVGELADILALCGYLEMSRPGPYAAAPSETAEIASVNPPEDDGPQEALRHTPCSRDAASDGGRWVRLPAGRRCPAGDRGAW